MSKSKLINSGSFGCVFTPKIPCDKEKKTKKSSFKKSSGKETSKLLFAGDNESYNEFQINNFIKTIENHQEWTVLWTHKCLSPEYKKLKKISEIKKCIEPKKKKIKNLNDNTKFLLYQGVHGGNSSRYYMKKYFTESIFKDEKKFNKEFIDLFKRCKYLFMGIHELSKHNLCHHDLNGRNILYKNDRFILIDYGLSIFLKDSHKIIQRMLNEFKGDRIYESYPFEYIYYPNHSKEDILDEQEEIAEYIPRNNYNNLYKSIHSLSNEKSDDLRFELLEDKLQNKNKPNLNELLKKLDVFSLANTILTLLFDKGYELGIESDIIINLLQSKELKSYIDLLNHMLKFHYKDRISADEAYKGYLNLIS